ncbi:DNA polymerase I [Acinetobacter virus vB_AbaP_AGC01]|uniref:DNA polymerase I n=1 Tax=Acinetobacter virus vB_AbaP_AGC01 TaxID=2723754 RepID=A0A6H0X2G6_9CAUD|nr:DNA polymerase I [Acinetobacter virus vB_AbaP_AGC01]
MKIRRNLMLEWWNALEGWQQTLLFISIVLFLISC